MYKKYELNNCNLYLIKMNKFKTISMSVNFRRENTKGDEVYRHLLKEVILLATNKYHDLDKLSMARLEIYDPHVSVGAIASGKERWIYIESVFANEKYTEKGMNDKTIKFILDYFWNPYIVDGGFAPEVFNICKHEYIEDLKSIKDNPDRYIKDKIWEEMDIMPFDEGKIEDCIALTQKITPQDLYNYYQSIFEKDALDIFIAGDFDEKEMVNTIKPLIKGDFKKHYKNRLIEQTSHRDKIKEIIEEVPNEQSKLAVGLKQYNLTEFERKYSSLAYINLLGGGWNSKLNKTVREKNSMCYYIYATRQMTFNVGFIYSGIAASNYEKVLDLIKEEMEKIKKGQITEEELNVVKDTYTNALINIEDNQMDVVDNIISEVFSDTDAVPDRIKNMSKVTIDDIKNVAKKIEIDTIYLLKGEE